MPWRDLGREPTAKERIGRIIDRWPDSAIEFSIVLAFFWGLTFVLDPLLNTVPRSNGGWGSLGETTLFAIGIALMGSAMISALFPERGWSIASTFVLCGFGIFTSIHPFNVLGVFIWGLIATGAVIQERRRIQQTGKP